MEPSKLTIAAGGTFAAFVLCYALGETGAQFLEAAVPVSAAVALPLAACLAVRTVASVWRGPVLIGFPSTDAVACAGNASQRVREAAQLRGSLGGAGHVYRGRLVLPAAAWISAALVTGRAIEEPRASPGWAAALLVAAFCGSLLLPARPFWYREARDGAVLVHPRAACARLLREHAGVGEEVCGHDANGG